MKLFLLFLSSFVATFLSAMSGGGASMVSVPIYLALGVPLPLATSAHKFSALVWTPVAARNYLKGEKVDWRFLLVFAGLGLVGAFIGFKLIVSVDVYWLEKTIAVLILLLVLHTALKKERGVKQKSTDASQSRWMYVLALPMGVYESILGSGNGIIFANASFKFRGMDFVHALGYYFAIAFFWVSFVSVLFVVEGYFDLGIMLVTVVGSVLGSYLGSKLGKLKGNRFIKRMFVLVGFILGIKLLLGL